MERSCLRSWHSGSQWNLPMLFPSFLWLTAVLLSTKKLWNLRNLKLKWVVSVAKLLFHAATHAKCSILGWEEAFWNWKFALARLQLESNVLFCWSWVAGCPQDRNKGSTEELQTKGQMHIHYSGKYKHFFCNTAHEVRIFWTKLYLLPRYWTKIVLMR